MWINSDGTYVIDQRVEYKQDSNTESVLNFCFHEKCWWETIASQSKLRSNWWTCFAHFTIIQPGKVFLPKIRNVNSFRKKTPLVYPVPKREPKTAFEFPDWPPPLCQDGRHGQANKTRPAGLPHTCSGNFKAIINYNQFSIHSNNQYQW